MALASFSPSLHTSTEVPDWKHFCTSWHTAGESPGAHSSFGFLQPVMVTMVAIRITVAKIVFRIGISLERLRNIVITIGWQQHVLGKVHFHSMPFPNRDRGWNLHEPIEDCSGRLRDAGRRSVGEQLRTTASEGSTHLFDLGRPGNYAQCNGRTEDLQVVIINFVF